MAMWTVLKLQQAGAPLVAVCRALIVEASLVAGRGLSGTVISNGTRSSLLYSMWALPSSGTEPVSPPLTGRFFIT